MKLGSKTRMAPHSGLTLKQGSEFLYPIPNISMRCGWKGMALWCWPRARPREDLSSELSVAEMPGGWETEYCGLEGKSGQNCPAPTPEL